MGFMVLHSRNHFCGEDPVIVNSEHILSVEPVRGQKKWSLDVTGAHITLATGKELDVSEPWDAVMGMLREAQDGQAIPGTGPFLKVTN